jgi:hypothetical protein
MNGNFERIIIGYGLSGSRNELVFIIQEIV